MERIDADNLAFLVATRDIGNDGGPSIEVHTQVGDKDVQLLRFDCFRVRPHYHYDPNSMDEEHNLDTILIEDSLPWALTQLRHRLPQMVEHAGYPEVAGAIQNTTVTTGLDEVEAFFQKESAVQST